MECLLPYLCMVTVPHIMVGIERMLSYRRVGLVRFYCMYTTQQALIFEITNWTSQNGLNCKVVPILMLMCS